MGHWHTLTDDVPLDTPTQGQHDESP
jgi:hypothetical protein